MTKRLLLDEHYSDEVAANLFEQGHDVTAVVALKVLRGESDEEVYAWAAAHEHRIVTENIKDFRPLLLRAIATDGPIAPLLLVPPRRYPRGGSSREAALTRALLNWLTREDVAVRPVEDWLV